MTTELNPFNHRLHTVPTTAFSVTSGRGEGDARRIPLMHSKVCWIIWTNTDLTEGRGGEYAFGITTSFTTAQRVARHAGVMGGPARIEASITFMCDVDIEQGMMHAGNEPSCRQHRMRFWPVDPVTRFFTPTEEDLLLDKEGAKNENELTQKIQNEIEREKHAAKRAAALERAHALGLSPEDILLLSM